MVLHGSVDLNEQGQPLHLEELPIPQPGPFEVLIKTTVCGVCHTELDEIEGRTPPPEYPVVLGHQVVGYIEKMGAKVKTQSIGERVGVAWIFSSCGECQFCLDGRENLCPEFQATGRDANGGYAEYMIAHCDYIYTIPEIFEDAQAAPLLCAGAIGYRSLKLTGMKDHQLLGLTGFGASGHLVLKMVKHKFPNSRIYVFARSKQEQEFARELGSFWVGDTLEPSPDQLDCIIDTTPVWTPVVEALANLKPGGRLVINAIRKEGYDQKHLLKLHYADHLWLEKEIKSVANVQRSDVEEFLSLAAVIPIIPEIQEYSLEQANNALLDLKQKHIKGAKVLRISSWSH